MDLPEYEQLALFEVDGEVSHQADEPPRYWVWDSDVVLVSVPRQVVQSWDAADAAYAQAQREKGVYYDAALTASSSSDLAPAFTD